MWKHANKVLDRGAERRGKMKRDGERGEEDGRIEET